jgi:hypothetical protein
MADKYAYLCASERVDAAVDLLKRHNGLTIRKAAEICNVHHSSVI